LESGRVEEKTRKEKTRRVDLARPGQKPGCNLLTFFFLLKQRNFDLKKKLTRMTRSKPRIQALYWIKSKNYDL
jgi:hypothetical protein